MEHWLLAAYGIVAGTFLIAVNKWLGGAINDWNDTAMMRPLNRAFAVKPLHRTASGNYPFIIVGGAFFIAMGLLAVVFGAS